MPSAIGERLAQDDLMVRILTHREIELPLKFRLPQVT
jgi:hypothetical protein